MLADDVKTTVAVIVAAIALIGTILNSAASLRVSRRSTYLNAVTVERSKWIDKLRSNISKLIALAHAMDVKLYRDKDGEYLESDEYDRFASEIVETMAFIRLQLNPQGEIDSNILRLMTAIQHHVGEQDYKNLERVFVRHVQWLLKEEWEKVKTEALGWIGRLWSHCKAHHRKIAYRQFCAGDGTVDVWSSE